MGSGYGCSRSTPITTLPIDVASAAQGKASRAPLNFWGLDTPGVVWDAGHQTGDQDGRVLEVVRGVGQSFQPIDLQSLDLGGGVLVGLSTLGLPDMKRF